MRRVLGALILFSVGAGMAGCATITMSAEENQDRYDRNLALMGRQIGDDWDYFLLAHRPSRLTFYHTR